jgi:hypothetical protein
VTANGMNSLNLGFHNFASIIGIKHFSACCRGIVGWSRVFRLVHECTFNLSINTPSMTDQGRKLKTALMESHNIILTAIKCPHLIVCHVLF